MGQLDRRLCSEFVLAFEDSDTRKCIPLLKRLANQSNLHYTVLVMVVPLVLNLAVWTSVALFFQRGGFDADHLWLDMVLSK